MRLPRYARNDGVFLINQSFLKNIGQAQIILEFCKPVRSAASNRHVVRGKYKFSGASRSGLSERIFHLGRYIFIIAGTLACVSNGTKKKIRSGVMARKQTYSIAINLPVTAVFLSIYEKHA